MRYQCGGCPSNPTAFNLVPEQPPVSSGYSTDWFAVLVLRVTILLDTRSDACIHQVSPTSASRCGRPVPHFAAIVRLKYSVRHGLIFLRRYKIPTGPAANAPQSNDPRGRISMLSCKNFNTSTAYLTSLVHSSALCDRCMTPIEGEWFRCCYCSRDLCDACEAVDTHNDTHVFIVLKSVVSSSLNFIDIGHLHGWILQVDMELFKWVNIVWTLTAPSLDSGISQMSIVMLQAYLLFHILYIVD